MSTIERPTPTGEGADVKVLDDGQALITPLGRLVRRLQGASLFPLDALAWAAGIVLSVVLRYELDWQRVTWPPLFILVFAVVVLQLSIGLILHLYRGRHPKGSFAEVRSLAITVGLVSIAAGLPVIVFGLMWAVPRSAVFLALPFALVMMFAGRYLIRLSVENGVRRTRDDEKAIVVGAGYLGASIVRRMLTDQASPYWPVGLLDDDPFKKNLWLDGVRVYGSLDDLSVAVERTGATTIIVAVARADANLMRRVFDSARGAGLTVKVLPPLSDILEGRSRLGDLRDVSIEDLIGRRPVDTNVESVAMYLEGKRVLVTGAGGSIGAELCRQIARFGPAELIMVDRDETALQSVQLIVSGNGLLTGKEVVLADIRDREAIHAVFRDRRPEVVFHAAALKHLPMLEQYPQEAWKTNVLGTLNVLYAAQELDVEVFVNISTDKAASPTSALGKSKLLAERLTAWAAQSSSRPYLSVRFGNVLGSRGSMLPTFASLIEAGGPLTVTHPEATRFFMTIPEACQLVMQAGGIGGPGEVLILDMGEPVRILDVAQRMIELSQKDIGLVFTGLRPGEKVHEVLAAEDEVHERRVHPKIAHARAEPLDPADLDESAWEGSRVQRIADPDRFKR